MNKTILITGSSGFIGTHFIKNAKEFACREVDLLTQEIDVIDFHNIDSVVHLAALAHQMKGCSEEQYFKVNRDLAYDLAKRAKVEGVRQFVLMSTVKVYGESTSGIAAWNEKTLCYPLDPYGKSKLEAENLIKSLEDKDFKVAIIRSPLVYGEGVKANMLKLIKLVNLFPILPFGGIKNKRSLVYIGNLVALLKIILQKQTSGIFIAGDQTSLSTSQLVVLMAEGLNKKIRLIKIPKFLLKGFSLIGSSIIDRLYGSLELDNRNTNERLQFTPPFSIEEGISQMIKWYEMSFKK